MPVQRLVSTIALVCCTTFIATADDGHERTDKLIERIEETTKEMKEGQKRMEKTLAAYQEMFSREEKHRRSAYKEVVKGLEKQEERSKKLRERLKELEKEAEKYFKEWNKSLRDIKEGQLRDRSKQRLEDTKRRYSALVRAGEEAQESFGPVVESLHDQVVYLGHDLNQASVDSLRDEQAKIDDLARGVIARIASFSASAEAYVASLNP